MRRRLCGVISVSSGTRLSRSVSEYDVRRPLVPSGTNLLGIVKHVAYLQLGYLGDCFGRPSGIPTPWDESADDPDADLWIPAHESWEEILDLFRRSAEHADATLDVLDLDVVGRSHGGPRRDDTRLCIGSWCIL